MNQLSEQQINFFETFGYLALPGLFSKEIDWIKAEFEAVFQDASVRHERLKRTTVTPFIDRRESFCKLLDHPAIEAIGNKLLGADFNYLGSDGNYYVGDTPWHSDGAHRVGKYIKLLFYLSPVGHNSGALRVIPGSHLLENGWEVRQAQRSHELWGIEQSEVPSITLESQPGDLVIFHHNLMHASFGGNQERPMFTMKLARRAVTEEELQDLDSHMINLMKRWGMEHMYSPSNWNSAPPARLKHLAQVLERIPALTNKIKNSRLNTL
jgi:hypothetical protein